MKEIQWTLDNIYTIARREARRPKEKLRPEMWNHVIRLCEAAGCISRGVLKDNGGSMTMLYDKIIQETLSTWMLKMRKCLKTGNVIGAIDWQKQAECRCEKCEEFFTALREGKV